ncbi:hypothetical protein [Geminicoccus roseus]|uniref:hypothetical protein n=1 Tax=Geminicoccus roseus TaxID=404900 RepID=UPI0004246269|nr:hypothetical protein [Geminicoccus roseus]
MAKPGPASSKDSDRRRRFPAGRRTIELNAGGSVLVIRPDLRVANCNWFQRGWRYSRRPWPVAPRSARRLRTLQAMPDFDPAAGFVALMTLRIVSRIDVDGDLP